MHRAHYVRVGVEGAAGEADVRRPIVAEPLHVARLAADDTDRQAAAKRLAVGHQIGGDAKIFLGAPIRDAKSDEDLVKDQRDRALCADLTQLHQPPCVGTPVERCASVAGDQGAVRGGGGIWMQRLKRIDQDARNVVSSVEHPQRRVGHVAQGIGRVSLGRIPYTRLHVVPPPVVRAAKADQARASCVVAAQPHRLHHCFSARHVERNFVETRDRLQFAHVLFDDGMIGTEHGSKVSYSRDPFVHAFLVEVVAEQVDAIRARQIKGGVAVEVGHADARRLQEQRPDLEAAGRVAAELERNPIAPCELQIGHGRLELLAASDGLRFAFAEDSRQMLEARSALVGDRGRRAVTGKELLLAVLIERDEARDPFAPGRMSLQRRMLRAAEPQPRPHSAAEQYRRDRADNHEPDSRHHDYAR